LLVLGSLCCIASICTHWGINLRKSGHT
jgi:hypothetical protein